jgi:hypothetical protein
VANEHEKLKCHNAKSITISQINLTELRYKGWLGAQTTFCNIRT